MSLLMCFFSFCVLAWIISFLRIRGRIGYGTQPFPCPRIVNDGLKYKILDYIIFYIAILLFLFVRRKKKKSFNFHLIKQKRKMAKACTTHKINIIKEKRVNYIKINSTKTVLELTLSERGEANLGHRANQPFVPIPTWGASSCKHAFARIHTRQ